MGENNAPPSRNTNAPAAEPTAQGFDEDEEAGDDEEDEMIVFDAPPEALIDNAQGFAPEPIDDASGFDPTPSSPQDFTPEPVGQETFGE